MSPNRTTIDTTNHTGIGTRRFNIGNTGAFVAIDGSFSISTFVAARTVELDSGPRADRVPTRAARLGGGGGLPASTGGKIQLAIYEAQRWLRGGSGRHRSRFCNR